MHWNIRETYADYSAYMVLRSVAQGVCPFRKVILDIALAELQVLNSRISRFQKNVGDIFADNCSTGLFTLKFHLLHHIVEDLRRFGTLSVLDASPLKYYNVHIKTSYSRASGSMKAKLEETVKGLQLCGEGDQIGWTST